LGRIPSLLEMLLGRATIKNSLEEIEVLQIWEAASHLATRMNQRLKHTTRIPKSQ